MIKLSKGEKSLWQMPFDMYLIDNDKKCSIECFMLTTSNIRVQYWRKVSFFKKELEELVLPLEIIKVRDDAYAIYFRDVAQGEIEIGVETKHQEYSFFVNFERKKSCEKQINEFIDKANKSLKKNDEIVVAKEVKTNVSNLPIKKNTSPYIQNVERLEVRNFLFDLGESILSLNDANVKKIRNLFPVPIEHNIIWADCEFDLRCSGIVCTDKGCFIKSNVKALDEKKKSKKEENGGKSILYYYKWCNFSPSYFISNSLTNYVLTVDEKCRKHFLSVCKSHSSLLDDFSRSTENFDVADFNAYVGVVAGVTEGVVAAPNSNLDFMDQYIRNVNGRHGFFAEQANNMADISMGRKATVIGGDNAKNGADRLIKRAIFRDQYIQTKYCKTAHDSLNAAFDKTDGLYKYVNEDMGIMQLEVPSDQYYSVLEGFKEKIRQGKVVDANGNVLTNPELAKKYVRQGHYTYDQTVKMAEPGNIESLKYDIRTGMVTCMFAFGISSLITMVVSYRKNKDLGKAIEDGLKVGVKVFGLTMINHVLLSQLYRTSYFQNFTGNILLRNTLVTSGVALVVYSIPDIINVLSRSISFGQFVKNTVVLGSGILGGAGGAYLGGEIGEAIGGRVGKFVGSLLGGAAGGIAGAFVGKSATDVVKEDDTQIFSRLFGAIVSSMVIDYMLDDKEIEALSVKLNNLDSDDIKSLTKKYRKSTQQESVITEYLTPIFNDVARKRKKFSQPKESAFVDGFICLSK